MNNKTIDNFFQIIYKYQYELKPPDFQVIFQHTPEHLWEKYSVAFRFNMVEFYNNLSESNKKTLCDFMVTNHLKDLLKQYFLTCEKSWKQNSHAYENIMQALWNVNNRLTVLYSADNDTFVFSLIESLGLLKSILPTKRFLIEHKKAVSLFHAIKDTCFDTFRKEPLS